MTDDYGIGRKMQPRGPYGTNEGDTWLMGEYYQERLQAENGPGWRMCVAMLRNKEGNLEEHYYTTENPEMVKEADEGHEKWLAQQASQN